MTNDDSKMAWAWRSLFFNFWFASRCSSGNWKTKENRQAKNHSCFATSSCVFYNERKGILTSQLHICQQQFIIYRKEMVVGRWSRCQKSFISEYNLSLPGTYLSTNLFFPARYARINWYLGRRRLMVLKVVPGNGQANIKSTVGKDFSMTLAILTFTFSFSFKLLWQGKQR